jgi:hypothetical protein
MKVTKTSHSAAFYGSFALHPLFTNIIYRTVYCKYEIHSPMRRVAWSAGGWWYKNLAKKGEKF